jgi:fructoselysine-6-P-deglycase FrlB-like protein
LRSLAERVRGGVRELASRIEQSREVFMIGCGSAAHAAQGAQTCSRASPAGA